MVGTLLLINETLVYLIGWTLTRDFVDCDTGCTVAGGLLVEIYGALIELKIDQGWGRTGLGSGPGLAEGSGVGIG